jgi:GGDEF domain-containing protein
MLFAGFVIIGAISLIALVRGVDRVEVAGTLFFIPVFAGFLFFRLTGGLLVAVAATAGYLTLRWPAVQVVGLEPLAGQMAARVFGYVLFALGGGWAGAQLEASLDKLELYDSIDDDTGLFNARSLINSVDLEIARSKRYQGVFSVVVADFSAPSLDGGRRGRARLKELGIKLASSVRTVDHVVHATDEGGHVIAVVLPETGLEGAATVGTNLARHLQELSNGETALTTITFPGEEAELDEVLKRFRRIDQAQRPED